MFAPNGVVYDMSGGFGGRLFGFLVSQSSTYIGVEPSTKTFNGLNNIKQDYFNNFNKEDMSLFPQEKDIYLYKTGSEDFRPDKNSVDFCFTSPPYFNCEKYSNESMAKSAETCFQTNGT